MPSESANARPYAAEQFADQFAVAYATVTVLAAERTFLGEGNPNFVVSAMERRMERTHPIESSDTLMTW